MKLMSLQKRLQDLEACACSSADEEQERQRQLEILDKFTDEELLRLRGIARRTECDPSKLMSEDAAFLDSLVSKIELDARCARAGGWS